MNVIDLLPSPHQYFNLAVSLVQSAIANARRPAEKRRSAVEFGVDVNTGFFPRQPLPRLPAPFAIWELTLAEADEILTLWEDDSETAVANRPAGERWRSQVQSVSQVVAWIIGRFLMPFYSCQ